MLVIQVSWASVQTTSSERSGGRKSWASSASERCPWLRVTVSLPMPGATFSQPGPSGARWRSQGKFNSWSGWPY
jgi:hypothetical protein